MKPKKIPLRMCIGCREMKEKKQLLRVVRSPEETISLDPTGRKPGRGAYICREKECLEKAIRQHQIERAFSCSVSPDVYDQLRQQLQQVNGQ